MASRGQIFIDVLPETSKFAATLERDLKAVLKGIKVPKIDVDANTRRAREKIERVREEIERIHGKNVTVDVDERNLDGAIKGVTKKFSAGGRQAGLSFSLGFQSGLAGLGTVVGRLASGIAAGAKLTLLSAALAQTAVAAGHAAAALAPLAGLVSAIPTVAVAGASTLGVLALALLGVGDALSAGISGDTDKFAKALADLTPTAQKAVKSIVDFVTGLKQPVQTAFFDGLADKINNLSKVALPVLKKQLASISSSLGTFARDFISALGQPEAVTALNAALGSTAKALRIIGSAVAPLTVGLAKAAQAAAPAIESIAAGIGKAGTDFGNFLSKSAESGQLASSLDEAIAAFKTLGSIAGNIGGIFKSIFSAGATGGDSLLAVFDNLTRGVNQFFKSAEGADALKAVFSALSQVGAVLSSTLAVVLPAIGQALVNLAPAIGPLAIGFGEIVKAVAPVLPVLGSLANVISLQLADALMELAPIIAQVASQFAIGLEGVLPQITAALFSVLSAVGPLLPVLADMAVVIGNQLANAFATVAPFISQVASIFVSALSAILPQITAAFVQLYTALAPLLPVLAQLVSTIAGQLVEAIVPLVPVVTQIATLFGDVLADVLPQVASALLSVVSALEPILPPLASLIAELVSGLVPALTPLIVLLGQIAGQIGGILVQALIAILPPLIQLVPIFSAQLLPVLETASDAFIQLLNAILPLVPSLVQLLTALLPMIPSLIKLDTAFIALIPALIPLINILVDFANTFIQLMIPGIEAFNKIFLGPFADAMLSSIKVIARVATAFTSFIANVVNMFFSLPDRIVSAVSRVGSLLYNIGADIVHGLANGISNSWHFVTDKISGLVDLIPSGIRNALGIGSPSKVMMALGAQTGEGFALGIAGQQAAVAAAVRNLSAPVAADSLNMSGRVRGGDGAAVAGTPGPGVRVWPSQPRSEPMTLTIVGNGSRYSDLLVQELSHAVRVRGGNVQKVLGKASGGVS